MISVALIIQNEEKNIIDCLDTVSWADEIVVVDDYSTDRTIEVINSLPYKNKIKVFKRELKSDFSSQRNFALSKTTKEWILFVDADERITKELREEINSLLINKKGHSAAGFYIPRRDVMWGKMLMHGETGQVSLLRFAKRNSGIWHGKVHETWVVDGPTEILENYIIHYPHPTLDEFLKEINFYTTIRAKELFDKKINVSGKDILLYPKGKFLQNYFLRMGFMDGVEGLIVAILMSFHSFLVRGKLWLLWKKK